MGFPFFLFSTSSTTPIGERRDFGFYEKYLYRIRKELPFRIDSLRWFDGVDMATYQFAHQDYIPTLPDAEIGMNGEISVYRTFDYQKASRQAEEKVWRNVIVSKKNQRIICIDRYLRDGRTQGFVFTN